MRWSERVRRIARTRLGQLAGAIVAAWLILFVLPRLYHLLLPVNSEFLFQEARKIAESVQPAGNRAMAMAHIARALVHAGQVNRARRFAYYPRQKYLVYAASAAAQTGRLREAERLRREAGRVDRTLNTVYEAGYAVGLAVRGHFRAAAWWARGIPDPAWRAYALAEIAAEMKKRGM